MNAPESVPRAPARSHAPGPVLSALLAAVLFGASTPAAKILLGAVGPVTLAGLLYLGAAAGALPFAVSRGARRLSARTWWRLGGTVLFGGVIGPVLMLIGLERAGASSVSLWLSLETVFTAALARAAFREHLGKLGVVATVLVTAASALLALGSGIAVREAALLVALACVCWALDNNWTAVIDELSPAQIALAKGLVAGATTFGLGRALEHTPELTSALGGLAVGAVGYGLSLVLYVGAAQALGATRSQLLFSTAPLWGAAVAWVFAIDQLGVMHVVAAAMMALGLAVLGRERHEHDHVHPRVSHQHAHRHDDGHHDHVHPGLPADAWHTHEHEHDEVRHDHPHVPDLHHRHRH